MSSSTDKPTRIIIVDSDRCKPTKCHHECIRSCPVVRMGTRCIDIEESDKIAFFSEDLCVGCGICVKFCPFKAINIVNIPSNLDKNITHRYGTNSFKLHRLPIPKKGKIIGIIGANSTGKSTALKILSGKIRLNLGRHNDPPTNKEILNHFRGSELQNYFAKLNSEITTIIKPQYVGYISKIMKGNTVGSVLRKKDERNVFSQLVEQLGLQNIISRDINGLSGGELQKIAIATVCSQNKDIYMFDEPSSYLDIRQRLKASRVIRNLLESDKYVIVVEHDLSIMDYISDIVCILYGVPGAYGVVTCPFGIREGINIFLDGFVPTENLRFRKESLSFKVSDIVSDIEDIENHHVQYNYPNANFVLGSFELNVEGGMFNSSEIIMLVGENGTGKTTFMRFLAGLLKPKSKVDMPKLQISYKPQEIHPKFRGTVQQLLDKKTNYRHPQFMTDVIKPLGIESIFDQQVLHLSGGELQRVAIVLALGKPADIYLIDEPSAYLDSEQRIIVSKVIKRYILHANKTAFIVEHDFIMATYMADRVIVYDGEPGLKCIAHSPQSLTQGMNMFLKNLEITFRRDSVNYRPRINKYNSIKDRQQKEDGKYFFVEN